MKRIQTGLRLKPQHFAFAFFLMVLLSSCKKDDPDPYYCSGEDGILCNVAGIAGKIGGSGNGGHAQDAYLYWPMDVVVDNQGQLIVVDFNNHCVRVIDETEIIDIIIGSGFLGDDPTGTATGVSLNHPTGITIDADGNYWLAAWHNWKMKKIDKDTWAVTSPIGTSQGFSGDGGPADQAQLNLPSSMVFDAQGNMYISDQGNQCIRKVDPGFTITTLAGGTEGFADGIGANAMFSLPKGSNAIPGGKMELTNDGNFLILADTKNNRVRKIDIVTGEVSTIAGTGTGSYTGDGGPAVDATLFYPTDIAIGEDNMIYVADSKNNVIRRIDPAGNISTVAGTGEAGFSDNGTPAKEAKLHQPFGVYVAPGNVLYISDTYNQQVKKVANP